MVFAVEHTKSTRFLPYPAMIPVELVAMNMAALAVEGLLLGVFIVLFGASVYLRVSRFESAGGRPRSSLWWNPVLLSMTALFLLCIAHWILTLIRFFRAFLMADSALWYYSKDVDHLSSASIALAFAAIWLGDAIVIHRLWVLWGRDVRIVTAPIASWLGLVASGIASIFHLVHDPGPQCENDALTATWTLGTLYVEHFSSSATEVTFKFATSTSMVTFLVVLAESGALMAMWNVFYAAIQTQVGELIVLTMGLTPPIVGLANMLIYIRIGLGWSIPQSDSGADSTGIVITSDESMLEMRGTRNMASRL
ncbi:hypothetical protein C8F01DRAFT_1127449 [Mycena amicta]|nr:hypothetical protein C8F01DRAFT_1127449 [Mycena amicta]